MKHDRILWITPKWPYPPEDGAKVATRALLRSLPNRDQVDVLALAGEDESCDIEAMAKDYSLSGAIMTAVRQGVGTGWRRHLRNLSQMLFHRHVPVTVARYASPELQQCFRSILAENAHGVIVFDGLHSAAITGDGSHFSRPEGVKIVYRAHNVEWQIWQKAAENASLPFRPLLRRQAALMKRFETSVMEGSDLVAPVSVDDQKTFASMAPNIRMTLTPIGLNFSEEPPPFPTADGLHLVFLARLDWPPNRDGLHWFLTRAWPKVTRTDVRLSIAGVGDGEWLQRLLPMKGVDFLGRIESPDQLYSESHAAIVPIFYGGGTRLKMIEPARFGRPCISTKAGALGSTLEPDHYVHAETADEWAKAIDTLTVDDCRRIGAIARDRLKETFDEHTVANRFADEMSQLV